MNQAVRFGFIGAGNMAEALIGGMLTAGLAQAPSIRVSDVSSQRLDYMHKAYEVQPSQDNVMAVEWSDVVLLCVKPQSMEQVLGEIHPKLGSRHMLVSVAAGYPINRIQQQVGDHIPIVRAMPNTPSAIRQGVTALAWTGGLESGQIRLAQQIFESVGKVVLVDESLMDAVTGVSGSGPAYVYLFIEALMDAAVRVGLPRATAHVLATQTVLGAAQMVEKTGDHPALLKDRVTSPGGTTIAGLRELEAGRLRATVMKAVEAATNRSLELGSPSIHNK